MKFYLISDNMDTLIGMRMVGVEGVIAHQKDEVIEHLEYALAQDDIAIIMITLPLAHMLGDKLNTYKNQCGKGVIVEIPTRRVQSDISKQLDAYVGSAIGMKL